MKKISLVRNSLIAVTGGAGFVGGHLVEELLRRGCRVACLDALTYAGSLQHLGPAMTACRHAAVDRVLQPKILRDPRNRLVLMRCDLNDTAALAAMLGECAGVFSLAAETHVDYSYHAPGVFVRANVNGTHSLLEAWRMVGRGRRLLHVSTDEVYGQVRRGFVTETAPLRPRNIYAATKAAGDLLVQTYQNIFQLDIVTVRPCNIYGPRQQAKDLLPKTFAHLMQNRRMPIHGDGRHVREYLYVGDAVRLLADLYERGRTGETYNLCSHEFHSTRDIVRRVARLLGKRFGDCVEFTPDRPNADRRYAGDNRKVRRLLGRRWRLTPFERGLASMRADFSLHPPPLLP